MLKKENNKRRIKEEQKKKKKKKKKLVNPRRSLKILKLFCLYYLITGFFFKYSNYFFLFFLEHVFLRSYTLF